MNKKVESQMLNDCQFHKPIIVQRSAVSTFTLVPGPPYISRNSSNKSKMCQFHVIDKGARGFLFQGVIAPPI